MGKYAKMKTEYTNLMWRNNKVKQHGQQKSALEQVIKITMHWEQTWKYRDNKLYKRTDTMRQT